MSNKSESVIRRIVRYGDIYFDRYLEKVKPHSIVSDWWQGWLFLSDRIFFQGRADRVSVKVRDAALEVLESELKNGLPDFDGRTLRGFRIRLSKYIGKDKVGKSRDVDMVISALEFSLSIPERNIVANSVAEIKQGNLRRHRENLMGIVQIGPKISSFYLRDLIDVCKLENYLSEDDYALLQPVDTWVRQVAERIGIIGSGVSTKVAQGIIAEVCKEEGVSPIRFNQGAWYVGANAFEVVLDLLEREGR